MANSDLQNTVAMPSRSHGRGGPPRRPRKAKAAERPTEDEGFGFDAGEIPPMMMPIAESGPITEPAAEILALGPPPADAAGIQKWNYQLLSTRAWLVAQTPGLTDADRDKRVMQLTQAAARHFPMAAKHDLNESIKRDAEAIAGRKRAKAAGKADKAIPSGSAKIIPIRRDA